MYKRILYFGILTITIILLISGCKNDINVPDSHNYDYRPVPPQGLIAIAQDKQVYLTWYKNYESYVAGYNIYVSNSYKGRYTKIGYTAKNEFYDRGVSNGTTYYYAVTAYDGSGYESELSLDNTFATPRPELFSVTIYDYKTNPNTSGYNLAANAIVSYTNTNCDIYYENANGVYYMNVFKDSDIQDMGYTNGLDDISKSPSKGWSPTKDVQLIIGHTYVVWTFDNHYAKFRIISLSAEKVTFDCAFQLQPSNPYLKRSK